jgi:5-methylcytosine-specific restriction protein A
MFKIDYTYTKKDIYRILTVPKEQQKGSWDTGYRSYRNNIFIFSNVGVPGRTGSDYNNYWDGELFVWEAKTNSNSNQPLIKKMISKQKIENIYLFTRIDNSQPFTFEGTVVCKDVLHDEPVRICWKREGKNNYSTNDVVFDIVNEDTEIYEGTVKQVIVNKYERNPLARRICIEHHGKICKICNFDFHKVYGEFGKDFIHVHHIIPLYKIKKEYSLNPIKDLIPVCANCHAVIHRKKEALSIDEIKDSIIN